ncbi:oxysterol-binding protein-like protein OBPalpha [Colletotrichum spaethianum]|uniref:Oxysterol-binding protein-like protein OBPalpha n=1 Tax=Colletotrichum spaethianum TaxID=700344 RepID=A0AA37P4V4_9PEZI|nr:oxysterol-binding protein-like protein OBPalpha [Colletotrichum spaethianum]GKT42156.1 oxysterol-binding protein-like protein OBPalpha [Colletotrichum spaethianum]
MLLPIPEIDDPVLRFVSVVKFYLSGWHIRPPGVKKPLNPILGEIFTCYWDLPDNTKAYYISEQTSHHPPKSSYFYMVPEHHIRVDGTLKPRSKFLGNSAASMMEGTAVLSLLNRGKDKTKGERYILTQPNMYARGILFGKMKYELGDHSFVRCPELDLVADIEFKTKGWVSGTYNAIGGFIKHESTGEVLYELSGLWSEEMYVKDVKTGHKEMFFNARKSKPSSPLVRPIEEQDERESQKLWLATAQAVKDRNHELATDEKTKVEDRQREEREIRTREGIEWHPRLFRSVQGGPGGSEEGEEELEWIINAKMCVSAKVISFRVDELTRSSDSTTPEGQTEQILAIYPILPGQKPSATNAVTPHRPSAPEAPVEEAPADKAPAVQQQDGGKDLIDFGDAPAATPSAATFSAPAIQSPAGEPLATQESRSGSKDIQSMLNQTGSQPAKGPLMDFTTDMKKNVPSLNRADTSEDSFHDALESN